MKRKKSKAWRVVEGETMLEIRKNALRGQRGGKIMRIKHRSATLPALTSTEEVTHGSSEPKGRSDTGRSLHDEGRREVRDVQADEGRLRIEKERRESPERESGELEATRTREGPLDGRPPETGVPAGNPAGADVRQQEQQAPERAGEVSPPGKYPLNMETGPTVTVEGTEIVTEQ